MSTCMTRIVPVSTRDETGICPPLTFSDDEQPPQNMPAGLGWDTLVVEQPQPGGHRTRHRGIRSPFPSFMFGGTRDPLSGMFSTSGRGLAPIRGGIRRFARERLDR